MPGSTDWSDSDTELAKEGSSASTCTASTSLDEDDLDTDALHPYDVVVGRHKEAFNNVGNRRFRVTVSLALDRYLRAPTRKARSMVIARLADLVHENGGRFLEQETRDNSGISGARQRRTKQWVELSRKKSHQKVGHALRDMALVGTARHKEATAQRRQERRKRARAKAEPDAVRSSSPSKPTRVNVELPLLTLSTDCHSTRTSSTSSLESSSSSYCQDNDPTESTETEEMDLQTLMTLFSSSLTSLDEPLNASSLQHSTFREDEQLLGDLPLDWS